MNLIIIALAATISASSALENSGGKASADSRLVRPIGESNPHGAAEGGFPLGGARVIVVSSLKSDGEGSLRAALREPGPRLVVFEVGGVIDLGGVSLNVVEPMLFIAGESAPAPGITLIRGGLVIETHHVVVRHIAIRPGDGRVRTDRPWEPDGITIVRDKGPVHDVLIENCSATWAVDENASISGPRDIRPSDGPEATAHRVVFRNNLIAEALLNSTHAKGAHSMGLLVHDGIREVVLAGLGEVMLRLDPGEGRIRTARSFQAWEGGGEYNTSRGLGNASAQDRGRHRFVDNEVGHLVEDFIMQGGVATDFIKWREDDGIGRTVRNGLNFTERGFGVRGAVGNPDRGNTAASQLKPGDIDWDHIFGKLGARWFHTGGIFAALRDHRRTHRRGRQGRQQARHHRLLRPQLPPLALEDHRRPQEGAGGQSRDREVRRCHDRQRGGLHRLARLRDVKASTRSLHIELDAFKAMIETAVKEFPNFKVAATTLRTAQHRDGQRLERRPLARRPALSSRRTPNLEIFDRVGGGDSFASGLIRDRPTNEEGMNYG
jgi:2-dehydro-3-deoxygluconokinase